MKLQRVVFHIWTLVLFTWSDLDTTLVPVVSLLPRRVYQFPTRCTEHIGTWHSTDMPLDTYLEQPESAVLAVVAPIAIQLEQPDGGSGRGFEEQAMATNSIESHLITQRDLS